MFPAGGMASTQPTGDKSDRDLQPAGFSHVSPLCASLVVLSFLVPSCSDSAPSWAGTSGQRPCTPELYEPALWSWDWLRCS